MVYSFLTRFLILFLAVAAFAGSAEIAYATHTVVGKDFHWQRSANPFTLQIIDNVDPVWEPYLPTASSDWSLSSVLDTIIVPAVTVQSEAASKTKAAASAAPTCSLTLTENKIAWRTTNAQSVTITPTTDSPVIGGTLPLNGSATFAPPLPSGEHFYKLAVLGTNGSTAYCGQSVFTTTPVCNEPVFGKISLCNAEFGLTGWLGLGTFWTSGNHIVQAAPKLNDTYFNMERFNTPEERTEVVCHELGHELGLGHQDEDFNNPPLGSCLDYSVSVDQHPNAHDYEMLETIYTHFDSAAASLIRALSPSATAGTGKSGLREDFSKRKAWGAEIRRSKDGGESLFERDLGNGVKVFTHVLWVPQDTAQVGATVNTIQNSTGVQRVKGVQRGGGRQNAK